MCVLENGFDPNRAGARCVSFGGPIRARIASWRWSKCFEKVFPCLLPTVIDGRHNGVALLLESTVRKLGAQRIVYWSTFVRHRGAEECCAVQNTNLPRQPVLYSLAYEFGATDIRQRATASSLTPDAP